MNLRSGAFYRSGQQSGPEERSRASTLGSTARTPNFSTQVVEHLEEDTSSDSSMATSSTVPPTGLDLEYDGRLRYVKENTYEALIYKDFINRYVVKIEDHLTPFDPTPWVNFQGDRYMGKDGSMYMLTEFPEEVDKLGNRVVPEPKMEEEGPPKVDLPNFRLVNSMWVHRILIDDTTRMLYQRNDGDTDFFYLRSQIPEHMATTVKVLYVYVRTPMTEEQNLLMLDKYGLEWELLLPADIRDMRLTRLGVPIVGNVIGATTSSGFVYRGSGPIHFASSIEPPISTVKPTMGAPKVTFVDPRTSISGMGGSGYKTEVSLGTSGEKPEGISLKPTGSMGGSSGHPAEKVSTGPSITPLVTSGVKLGGSMAPNRHKTRPSHFQKWVKKFSGSGDPYDHLASFRQVVRAEEVSDPHVLKEGFGLTLEGKALSWFQTLDTSTYSSFDFLEKDFIGAFTKTGIKHSVSTLITNFKQEEKETVRDCANRLRQYIARCPDVELPSQAKAVSIFLEGLKDKSLHANLYGRKHKTLNECIYDAIDLDDNCDIYGKDKPITGADTRSTTSRGTQETGKDQNKDEAMVEMIMKRMNQVFRPPQQKQYKCDLCGGDHPTGQCLPKQNYQKPPPRTNLFCDYKQKWTNHKGWECIHRIRHLREQRQAQQQKGLINQAQGQPPNYVQPQGGGERAQPVLGNQPPLPGATMVRYIQSEEANTETALIPLETYGREADEICTEIVSTNESAQEYSNVVPEGHYHMDHNTLWFIANAMGGQGRPMGPRPYRQAPNPGAQAPPGPCYTCHGDHWVRDCPVEKKNVNADVIPLVRYCVDCGIKHIVQDCPVLAEKKQKTTLNYVEVIPSSSQPSSSSETEPIVPLNVITRAQAQAQKLQEERNLETAVSEGSHKTKGSWKARRERRAASKKRKERARAAETPKEGQGEPPQPIEIQDERVNLEPKPNAERPAGSVLADKHFEPLDALLQAYEARLKPLETLEERWRKYPDPTVEARQLDIYQRLVEAAQALDQRMKQMSNQDSVPLPNPQEAEQEAHTLVEDEIIEEVSSPQSVLPEKQGMGTTPSNLFGPEINSATTIPECDEDWGNKLWDAIKTTRGQKGSEYTKPPIEELDFNQKTLEMGVRSDYGDQASEASQESKAETLKTLPSYLGSYEAKSETKKFPNLQMPSHKDLDITNLSALMSAPIKCTLPLSDILKVKPELWEDVARYLKTIGIELPIMKQNPTENKVQAKKNLAPVPLNKVGDYCEGEDSNTTIPVTYNEVTTLAILDSGAGVAIATKAIWESWGRPALRKTRMKLQLADGYIERPIGLLEGVIVSSCGVEYEHTFAVVDFGKSPNYDIILGRPFMRQLKMIQDWGFNYIYLRQQEAITRINVTDHSYRDVARTPVEDFESATLTTKSSKPSWMNSKSHLWMCGASDQDEKEEKDKNDKDPYILDPFPNEKFVPDAWMDILATVDVCVNEVTPTVFCDEEGYDLVPFHMISIVNDPLNKQNSEETSQEPQEERANLLYLKEEISIRERETSEDVSDYSSEEEANLGEEYYDASDKLEDYKETEPVSIQLRDGREVPIQGQTLKILRKERRRKQVRSRGQRVMPEFKNKSHYLIGVQARDCVKDKVTGCYLAQVVRPTAKENKTKTKKIENSENKTSKHKEKQEKQKEDKPKLSKTERKAKYQELKRTLNKVWSTDTESETELEEVHSLPPQLKRYTIQERKIVVQQPVRTAQKPGESYDGLENAKKIDLANDGEEPRPAYIAADLEPDEEELLVRTLKEYRDVFAWSYRDLKGVDPDICQHTIPMREDAKPSRQRPYTYNDTFAKKIKEEIDKLLTAEFIYEIEHTD